MWCLSVTESTAPYIVRLRKLAKSCRFEEYNTEQAIRNQVVRHCRGKVLRTRFLKEEELSLAALARIAAAHEQAHFQSRKIERTGIEDTGRLKFQRLNTVQEPVTDTAT